MAVIEMVRGSLRPGNGRSPPFVIIGLVIIIGILGFNYWGLSTLNADLVSQVKKFEKDILKCSEEQKLLNDDTESLRMAVQKSRDNNKELEDIKEQHVAEIADLKSQIKTVEEKLDESTVALDEKVKLEAELEKQLKQLKEENTQLHQELNSERLKAQELASARQEAIHKQDPIKYSHGNKLPFLARGLATKGHLPTLSAGMVNHFNMGLVGLLGHNAPIIPYDPPDAIRNKPRFSVVDPPKQKLPA
ncbi:unnamed protein product [Darwinula stevensoni]|uniref:Uncharacterized protein n=1 Tax=Darwinula stevensoni TaxID=69355 RepID=A0A7R8XJ19_9CRUS|nr:unnamed protein product [Darwinula stevensoni]CAG0893963.1 unnamed protein product [Darwinula stevensoni]